MSVIGAALISFFGIVLLSWHLSRSTMQRVVGYAGFIDVTLHGSVIFLFIGTSTLGLMQAELSAIFFTLSLRAYRHLYGYQRFQRMRWVTYSGVWS
jgi:hypothetical protein